MDHLLEAWARASRCAGFALSLLLGGCGLASYEAEIARTKDRLAYLDQEDQLLGEPVDLRVRRGPGLFLRLPEGVQTTPNGPGSPAPDWLASFPWSDAATLTPPLELLVGLHPRTESREELESLLSKELGSQGAVLQRLPDGAAGREIAVTRGCDPPARQRPVRYRRFVLQGEEMPLWPAPQRAALPAPCIYRYEVFLHDSGDWSVAVIFKVLDRDATERMWKSVPLDAAEIRRLPVFDRQEFAQQRELCLATLRVGAAAEEAWQAWRGR